MIKKFPVIFSRTSHGQIQTWQIETEGNKYRTIEGLQDGALTTSAWTICEPKNVGKKNQTTGEEQAVKEAESKHKDKLGSGGYHEKVKDIDSPKFFEPMTAKKWKDRWKKVVFPVYCQPKLDGMRCVTKYDGMWSRYGKPVLSAPHIRNQLNGWIEQNIKFIFDGELYAHKFKKDFDKIISLARQGKPTEDDLKQSAEHLEYWIYDCFDPNHPNDSFQERYKKLLSIIKLCHLNNIKKEAKFRLVETTLCNNIEELDACYQRYLDDGMEGQMIRIPNSPYENKRSDNLLKRKEFIDKEFEISDILAGKGGHSDMAAKAILKMKNGETFEAGIIGSHEYCRELLKFKKNVIGKMATIVFQNYTPEGIPRFGKMKIVRDYE